MSLLSRGGNGQLQSVRSAHPPGMRRRARSANTRFVASLLATRTLFQLRPCDWAGSRRRARPLTGEHLPHLSTAAPRHLRQSDAGRGGNRGKLNAEALDASAVAGARRLAAVAIGGLRCAAGPSRRSAAICRRAVRDCAAIDVPAASKRSMPPESRA